MKIHQKALHIFGHLLKGPASNQKSEKVTNSSANEAKTNTENGHVAKVEYCLEKTKHPKIKKNVEY